MNTNKKINYSLVLSAYLQKSRIILFVFIVLLFLTSCGKKTEEDLILEFMEDIGRFAEKKDLDSIMLNLAADYTDFKGRDKWKSKAMIDQYFKQYRGIVFHVLSSRIEEIKPLEASIQTEIALSSGIAKVFRKLAKFSTDNYRLKIKLIKRNKKWKIKYAEWKYVSLEELYPESLSIFNKIFKIDSK